MAVVIRTGPPAGSVDAMYHTTSFEGKCYAADGRIPLRAVGGAVCGETACTKEELHGFAAQMMRPPYNTILYNHSTEIGPVGYVTAAWVTDDGMLMVSGSLFPQCVMARSPDLRSELLSGDIVGYSIGWDVITGPTGGATKRLVEVSIVHNPHFPGSLLTVVRGSRNFGKHTSGGYEPSGPGTRIQKTTATTQETNMEQADQPLVTNAKAGLSAIDTATVSSKLDVYEGLVESDKEQLLAEFREFCENKDRMARVSQEVMSARCGEFKTDLAEAWVSANLDGTRRSSAARASVTGGGVEPQAIRELRDKGAEYADSWISGVVSQAGKKENELIVSYISILREKVSALETENATTSANLARAMNLVEGNEQASATMDRLTGVTDKGQARASAGQAKRRRSEDFADRAPKRPKTIVMDDFVSAVLSAPDGMQLTRRMLDDMKAARQ